MSLLRIRCALAQAPEQCEWALIDEGREPLAGEGSLAQLPRHLERVQLMIPAAQVVMIRARLPRSVSRRRAGAVLAYAVEERIAQDPEVARVTWLGSVGEDDVLAVLARAQLGHWRDALLATGVRGYEVVCETLLLPWEAGEWSLAWDGREGFVRTGQFEGAASDCADRAMPPLSLRLMLEEARAHAVAPTAAPASIVLYTTAAGAVPDIAAWQRELGIPIRLAGAWDWRIAQSQHGATLFQERRGWGDVSEILRRLRPAAWIAGAALAVHAVALVVDWTALAREQRDLRRQMVSQFRATFPDAVAVVDPALQMRRKLAQARHVAGRPDPGDFLPMIVHVAAALNALPANSLRAVSYEAGRMTLELDALEPAATSGLVERLRHAGFGVSVAPGSPRAGGATLTLTLRVL